MSEIKIHDGDVITFSALKWQEDSGKTESPAILLTPVAHVYEYGIDLDTVIYEALIDADTDGKLCDMGSERLFSKDDWNVKYLKHIAHLIKKGEKFSDKDTTFWRKHTGFGRLKTADFNMKI
jgi:hypothetical protein